ncbi:unnamed protein product [Meloidogyne enterolobii]|uniref:Uncharacterized protein n=2 Tax=Meloidogyne enterolobii TaxID=390850 RepID=A0ACB0YVS9_MELEN
MVSKDRKRSEKKKESSRKRRSENASISSLDSVSEKRINVENDDQSNTLKSNRVRPCKKQQEGSGLKLKSIDPVSQASDDFENEVIQGICRDLDIASIESSSETNISITTLRRSTRHSSTISRFSEISFDDKWPTHRPVAHKCSFSHVGFGCGAKSAKHMPNYYNSMCKALLLPSETIGPSAFVKCCAKGRVDLNERFANLQDIPIGIDILLHNPANSATRNRLFKNVLRYNDQLSFGQLRMERTFDFSDSYRIVKTNNMFNYMLFDFRQPGGQHQPELRGQLYTIPPNSSEVRLNELSTENELDPIILQELFNILKQNHWMAELFKIASDVYQDLSADMQLQFRMLVVDANKRGTERTIENVV